MSEAEETLFFCTIPGRPRILKNGRKKRVNRQTGNSYTGPSDRFLKWATYVHVLFLRARRMKTIDFPVNLEMKVYLKDHQHEPDLSNAYQGVEDILQKVGIIQNDKLIYSHNGSAKIFGEERERVEIRLTRRG